MERFKLNVMIIGKKWEDGNCVVDYVELEDGRLLDLTTNTEHGFAFFNHPEPLENNLDSDEADEVDE